ncbi:MAG TPA: transporter [Vicinamibacterales bacterium]|jgi:hypothetical protein|nr:transporter [Vicinamibacterales bacterium]
MLVCRRAGQICMAVAITLLSAPLHAQPVRSQPVTTPPPSQTRPATTTDLGDTGLWFVPTGEVLPARDWSLGAYEVNVDYEQGFTDVSNWAVTFAAGLRGRMEVFGAWSLVTRIDRDVRPLFFPTAAGSSIDAGGVVNEYPFVSRGWSGNRLGDLRIGAKIKLVSQHHGSPAALALRGLIKTPTASDSHGAGTGKPDLAFDAVVSTEVNQRFELAGFGGFIARGDPDAFDLTNGIRWGAGVAMPTRKPLRLTAELHGEKYVDDEVAVRGSPAGVAALVAASSRQKSPIYASLGLTWMGSSGMFAGAGINWNLNMRRRSDLGAFGDRTGDPSGLQVRVGFHRGVRVRVTPPPPTVGEPSTTAGSPEPPVCGKLPVVVRFQR